MMGAFGAEAIGLTPAQERTAKQLHALDETLKKIRPWLAELTGIDLQYGYRREFLKPKIDYTKANSRGSRGVWFWWTLQHGHVYETKYPETWQRQCRRFLTIDRAGDVCDLTEQEVQEWLSARSASMS